MVEVAFIIMRKRKCLFCEKSFKPRRKDHVFCESDCQQWHYRRYGTLRDKKKNHPLFRCPSCSKKRRLPFDPIRDNFEWLKFKCECGFKPGT